MSLKLINGEEIHRLSLSQKPSSLSKLEELARTLCKLGPEVSITFSVSQKASPGSQRPITSDSDLQEYVRESSKIYMTVSAQKPKIQGDQEAKSDSDGDFVMVGENGENESNEAKKPEAKEPQSEAKKPEVKDSKEREVKEAQTALQIFTTPELSELPFAETKNQFYGMISIKAPDVEQKKRGALDLVSVIDRSGSMAGDRLKLAKATNQFMVQNLGDKDRLAIVIYDDTVETLLPLTHMDKKGKEKAERLISRIESGGSTNLSGGLLEGVSIMKQRKTLAQVSAVMLFTDGLANLGYTDAPSILRAIATQNASSAEEKAAIAPPVLMAVNPRVNRQRNSVSQPQSQPQPQPQPQQQLPQPAPSPAQSLVVASVVPSQVAVAVAAPVAAPVAVVLKAPAQPASVAVAAPVAPAPAASAVAAVPGGPGLSAPSPMKQVRFDESPVVVPAAAPLDLRLNCVIHTFGFGEGHDDKLLRALAEPAHGQYFLIENVKNMAETFADCLGGLLSTVAQRIKLKITPTNGCTVAKILSKFPYTHADGSYTMDFGDLQSEEQRMTLLSLTVPEAAAVGAEYELFTTQLSYFNVIERKEAVSAPARLFISRGVGPRPDLLRDYELDKQLNRVMAAQAMDSAQETAERNELERAKGIIDTAISNINDSISAKDQYCQDLIADLQRVRGTLKSKSSYESMGRKYMNSNSSSHWVQRSCTSSNSRWSAQSAYKTSARLSMEHRSPKVGGLP